jgi:hypothetical protein
MSGQWALGYRAEVGLLPQGLKLMPVSLLMSPFLAACAQFPGLSTISPSFDPFLLFFPLIFVEYLL